MRAAVGVFDVSVLAKFTVRGPAALQALQWLSTNDIDVVVGRVVYTPWCNDDGTLIADVTVARVAADRFLVVATDTVRTKVLIAIRAGIERFSTAVIDLNRIDLNRIHSNHASANNRDVTSVVDVTTESAIISVQGPNSRGLLGRLTDTALGSDEFRYMSAQHVSVAGIDLLAMRITFTGDLGWELHVPTQHATALYDAVFAAGSDLGVWPCGIDSMYGLAAEKGYVDFGYSIDATLTPLEANLGGTVAWHKDARFRGRDALLAQRESGPVGVRVVLVRAADPAVHLAPGDPVTRNGVEVGHIVAASYGHTVGRSVGYARIANGSGVDGSWLTQGMWGADTAPAGCRISVGTTAWFDPFRARVRA